MVDESLKEFQQIPGVGKSIAKDFFDLGYRSIKDLKGKNPEKIYDQFCKMKGCKVDRCMLYVFRLAVYFAEEADPDPKLLKWWNWKDNTESN